MTLNSHKSDLLAAILPHVTFDGWSQASFDQAVSDLQMDPGLAEVLAPRGAVDLAVAFHRSGDSAMVRKYSETDTDTMNIRSKVILAVRPTLFERLYHTLFWSAFCQWAGRHLPAQ